MSKILVSNNEILSCEGVRVSCNNIYFDSDGDYVIEYDNSSFINLVFNVMDGRSVNLFEYSCNCNFSVNNRYVLNRDCNLYICKFYCNKSVNESIVIDMNGENSNFKYRFSNICDGEEIYNVCVNHNCKYSYSDIVNRSICNNGKIDFTVDSVLPKSSIGCVLNQDTKIINLGDNYSTIRPNMYIDIDDVSARHGSVIGKFSDDMLFYLMSRGISYHDSIKLLVSGYVFSNLIVSDDYRKKISDKIDMYWR